MAPWLLPVLKAALPYVGNIVSAALPVFTKRREQEASTEVLSRQIAELQEAVTANAATVKTLAAQFQDILTALSKGEAEMAQRQTDLRESLTRCEDAGHQTLARLARLESQVAAQTGHDGDLAQHMAFLRRLTLAASAFALLALIAALAAWWR
jgi:hypothetical protein